ncbi:MAG: hypothetical protein ACC662_02965, partial [Planctomycetota bacterium]
MMAVDPLLPRSPLTGDGGPRAPERGIALLLVITVLVTLVIVAVPFAISMRQGRDRTTSEMARDRALFEAGLLLEAMKHGLAATHPAQEQQRWDQGERGVDSDPTVDSLDEITLGDAFRRQLEEIWTAVLDKDTAQAARQQALRARGLGPMNDDRGSIWTGVVQDANGRVNVNGASPYLLANLMGSALLSEDLDATSPEIAVSNVAQENVPGLDGFPRDGGYIRIGRETIKYDSFDGSTFRGCERGALPDTPLGDNSSPEEHDKNTPVIDYTAWKLATHLIAARPGYLTRFRTMEDLRSTVAWGAGGALPRDRLERLEPYLTLWSRRETGEGWLAAQLVANELPSSGESGEPDEVEVRDRRNPAGTTAYFNPGTLVRVTDGRTTAYQTIANVGDRSLSQRNWILTLSGGITAGLEGEEGQTMSFEGGKTRIEAYAPYPIDINTAPAEVLYACMANLHFYGADTPENIVTPTLAWDLAQRIVAQRTGEVVVDETTGRRARGPFRHIEDWGRFLERLEEESTITRPQRRALYFNAVNPHNHRLAFGTAPWCYRTLDVYHLEARVAINDAGGDLMATATVREVAEIGSDAKTNWTLDSQDDFEERLSMGSGAKWVATFPNGVNFRNEAMANIQPAPREWKEFLYGVYPSSARDEGQDLGDARLEPARIDMPGNTVRVVANHFDSSLFTEGWRTDYSGAYTHKVSGALQGKDDTYPQPFTLSFWWRSYSDANWTAFDVGMRRFQNRYAIFVTDGLEGQELVFRVASSALERRAAEIYVPLQRIGYKPGTWYHIQVSSRGEDPPLMELLVDGVSVGRRRTLTWLRSGLSPDTEEVTVESTEGFDSTGAIVVGSEVIEYESLTSESFRDCFRGARGTHDADKLPGQGRDWPSGTPVRQLGYSDLLLLDVMRGGASLGSTLGRWSAVRVANEVDTTTLTEGNTSYIFYGVSPQQTTFVAQVLPLWDETAADAAEAFGDGGIALLGSEARLGSGKQSADGYELGGWEFVYYTRAEGSSNVIQIERRGLERKGWTTTQNFFLTARMQATVTTTSAGGGSTS